MKLPIIFSLVFTANVFAAEVTPAAKTTTESQSTTKLEDLKPINKVDGNIDEEITNAKLRAESGSKSKFSLSSSIGYTGGSLEKPLGVERPNLAGTPGVETATSMDLGIKARFRADKNNSFTLGTSIGVVTPLQGDVNKRDQINVYDPNLGYALAGKYNNIQTTATLTGYYGTSKSSLDIKYQGGLGLSLNGLYDWGNGLSTGTSMSVGYNLYSNDPGERTEGGTSRPGFYGGDTRTQYSLGIFPYAEYKMNDRYALRTVFGYFNWRHLYGDDKSTRLLQTYVYQSVGLGISVTRDIYLYPNIQFVPDNIRDDFTNVALSATINIF